MKNVKFANYFREEKMNTHQYIAISLSAMSAGVALSASAILFFTDNTQSMMAMGIVGISCILSAASTVVVALGSKAQYERNDKRVTDTNSWFNDWMREHDHEHEIANVRLDRKMEEFDRNISQRIDHVERQISRMEETSASVISTLQSMMPLQDRG